MHGVTGSCLDFGARMYDPRLGRWLAVDPLDAKYPSLSPYSFAGNTPIMANDPDGEKIVIVYRDENGKKQKYVYQPGVDYEGDNKFVKQAVAALKYATAGDVNGIIQQISDHKKTIKIKQTGLGKDKYLSLINTIKWNPTGGLLIVDDDENETGGRQTPALGLFHEAAHGFLDLFTSVWSKIKKIVTEPKNNDAYESAEEKTVVEKYETPAAKKLGEGTRTNHNGKDITTKGSTTTEEAESTDKKTTKKEK